MSDDPHLPWDYVRWTLATRTGWTLEYIDALPLHEVYNAVDIWSWESTARAQNARYRK